MVAGLDHTIARCCDGGRGLYFEDPNGHLLEILTRRYGSGG
jgi:catechol 2,3-dioxygenase-like lactoylglutathione lyase family enzyme